MIRQLYIENFKSWEKMGPIRVAPLTGLFGANSSGKSSILQLLLLLKQTIESSDRTRAFSTKAWERNLNLGTFTDMIHDQKRGGRVSYAIEWEPEDNRFISTPSQRNGLRQFKDETLCFEASLRGPNSYQVLRFRYALGGANFGMQRINKKMDSEYRFEFFAKGYEAQPAQEPRPKLPPPNKFYGFPDQLYAAYTNLQFLKELVLAFEEQFRHLYYLGPLREYPNRTYTWGGDEPEGVGVRGEDAVAALLAARSRGAVVPTLEGRPVTFEERIAQWLQHLGLVSNFQLVGRGRDEYEVRLRRSPEAAEVTLPEMGFGISQLLPVLVLCYYVAPGSTIILEQPELHLHPAVQSELADVFIDVIKTRQVQIILESHSEHLVRRLQRRIAEEQLSRSQVSLYFTSIGKGDSSIEALQVDSFGNITNWPPNFFGDEMGDLFAMTEAAMRRRQLEQ